MKEAANYRVVSFSRCRTIDDIRYSLVFGVPVVFGAYTPNDFDGFTGVGSYSWSGVKDGRHAMCIIGYDNSRQAFRIQNSWGEDWGDGGRAWVAYKEFEFLDEPNPRQHPKAWCYHAYSIVADESRRTQLRQTTEPVNAYFFIPDGSVVLNGQQLLPPGSLTAAEATSHFFYGLRTNGSIEGYAENQWWNINKGAFPKGLNGGKGKMIAASGDFIYAVTQAGSVVGRVPKKIAADGVSKWELINLPSGETPIDVRFRDGDIYVASSDGDVFKRIVGQGWEKQN